MAGNVITSVEDTQRRLDKAVKAIHRDLDLKDQAKERMIRDVYEQARTEAIQAEQEEKERLEIEMKVARRAAFAPPVVKGADPVSTQQAYSYAYERIEDERDPQLLLERLQKAELLNDPFMAKAILVRGYELGNSTIVGRYFDVYPDERGYYDDFIEKAEEFNAQEKAMSLFSACNRIRPLEHYLA
jgi:hypothetical protein